MTDFITKDSGERIEYDSGMRRDVQTGKPRFDLMMPDTVPYEDQFLTRLAALLGRGAEKYGDRNWELAASEEEMRRFKASALRHCFQWFTGETDEDHAAATAFNLLAYETTKARLAAEAARKVESTTLSFSLTDVNHDALRLVYGFDGSLDTNTVTMFGKFMPTPADVKFVDTDPVEPKPLTAEELDRLPVGSKVVDGDGDEFVKQVDDRLWDCESNYYDNFTANDLLEAGPVVLA